MKGTINWQVAQIWKQIDGIGEKKAECRAESGLKSVSSGHNVSDKVHSFEYKDEVLRTARELGNFAKEQFGIKDMQAITSEVVESYIQSKIENGVSYGTISNYISHLDKIQIGLSKLEMKREEHANLFDRNDLREIRELAYENAQKTELSGRAYEDPKAIISSLNSESQLVARLQYEAGLRVSEASRIDEKQLHGNTLEIQGKGGYIQHKELNENLANELRNYLSQNERLDVKYSTYRDALKEAVDRTGQKWSGTHGLRHNFAQERMQEYQEQGFSREEALRATSEDMGHHRPEITETYLRW